MWVGRWKKDIHALLQGLGSRGFSSPPKQSAEAPCALAAWLPSLTGAPVFLLSLPVHLDSPLAVVPGALV